MKTLHSSRPKVETAFITVADLAMDDNIEAIVLAFSLSRDQNNAPSEVISSIDCSCVFEDDPFWAGIQFPRDFLKWNI